MATTATSRTLEYRRGGPADFDGLIELNRRVYGEAFFLRRDYFQWQFADGPDGPAIIHVAVDAGRIVGSYILMLQTLSVFGERQLVAHSVATVVDPDHRHTLLRTPRGLRTVFAHLADLATAELTERGAGLTYTFPNEQSHPTFIKFLSFTDMGVLPFYARPVRPGRAIGRKVFGESPWAWLFTVPINVAADARNLLPGPRVPAGVEIVELSTADESFDEIWKQCAAFPGVIRVRDRAYVRWRFFDHPHFHYTVLIAQRDGRPLAFVAAMNAEQPDRAHGGTYHLGHIVDFLCAPVDDARDILAALIARVCRELQRDPIEFIISGHSGSAVGDAALRKAGLHRFAAEKSPKKWPALVGVHDPALAERHPQIRQLDKWYFSLADNDTA